MNTNIFNFVKHLSKNIENGFLNLIESNFEEYQDPEKSYPSHKIEMSDVFLILYKFGELMNHTKNIKIDAVTYDGKNYHNQSLQNITTKDITNQTFYNIELRKFYLIDPNGDNGKFTNIKFTFNSNTLIRGIDMYLTKELTSACTIYVKDEEPITCLNVNEMDIVNELLSFPVTPYIEISDSLADLLKIEPSK